MRILQLRFKNLNSLAENWDIDFENSPLASEGLFAITGPTGAGKSTLLDAVCLALYGCTPRLGKITQLSNEIMSRHKSECSAELTFETQSGRYRCSWSQRRARGRSDGNLQPQKHEIADADTGVILAEKVQTTAELVERVTGMNFERFSRSMLLAQGGFAAFLQASSGERAPILEQITGTEIYSLISKKIFQRSKEEQISLELLNKELAGIKVLSAEERSELEEKIALLQEAESELNAKCHDTEKSLKWLNDLDNLKREIESLASKAQELEIHNLNFEPSREKLLRAERAMMAEGTFASLSSVRAEQKKDVEVHKSVLSAMPDAESVLLDEEQLLLKAEGESDKISFDLEKQDPIFKKVRELDAYIAEKQKIVRVYEHKLKESEKRLEEDRKKLYDSRVRLAKASLESEKSQKYLSENAMDKSLVEQFEVLKYELGDLQTGRDGIAKKEKLLKGTKKKIEKAVEALTSSEKELADVKESCARAQELTASEELKLKMLLAERPLNEYRREHEGLLREKYLVNRIADLEAERKVLQDGSPCPLCGSKEHPYASGNVPDLNQVDEKLSAISALIKNAEKIEDDLIELKKLQSDSILNMTLFEKKHAEALQVHEILRQEEQHISGDLSELEQSQSELTLKLSERLHPLGVFEISEESPDALISSLKNRLELWQRNVLEKDDSEKLINYLNSEINNSSDFIGLQAEALENQRRELENIREEHNVVKLEREDLFGINNPDEEETRLKELLRASLENVKLVIQKRDLAKAAFSELSTRAETLNRKIEERTLLLNACEAEFRSVALGSGFQDESEFISARMSAEDRAVLLARAKELDGSIIEIKNVTKNRQDELRKTQELNLSASSVSLLESDLEDLKGELAALREKSGGLKHVLAADAEEREKISSKAALLEAHKRENALWMNLNSLIGSADGKKYRNFAQGITFDIMIDHANEQLRKMTDRYLLVRDSNDNTNPLGLNVIDGYQGGEVRSSKNLSGGESFIVSLALALGLSCMASRNVRIDTLLLDEGFGTLDDDALDMALTALSGLRQEGKLIGVISHVAALRERIPAQIHIVPISGGRSIIQMA